MINTVQAIVRSYAIKMYMYWFEDNQQPIIGIKDWCVIVSTVQMKLHCNFGYIQYRQ